MITMHHFGLSLVQVYAEAWKMEERPWVVPAFLCAAALAAAFIPGMIGNLRKRQRKRAATHSKANIYHQHLLDRIQNAPIPSLSTEKLAQILSSSISELHLSISNGSITCTEVVTAFIKQVQTLGISLNSVVDERFSLALQEAAALDQALASGRSPGPLYGIPFSVKDMISVQGCVSTYGLARLCHNQMSEDALIVRAMKGEGAIPLVKGSMPQLGASIDTVNGIVGRCLNPVDKERTSGGSSGGDAALIASNSVPFGLAGDIAGSIRIPASFTGIYGLRPTSARTSSCGPVPKLSFPGYSTTWGPMARSVADLSLIMQVWCSDFIHQSDPLTPPIPYQSHSPALSSLRIGYISSHSSAPPCRTAIRAVSEAVELLQKQGFQVVEFQIPNLREFHELGAKYFTAFGEVLDEEVVDSEPLIKMLRRIYTVGKTPRVVKRVLAFLAWAFNYPSLLFSIHSQACPPSGPAAFSNLYCSLQRLKTDFQLAWQKARIDLLIAPFPVPAPPHDSQCDQSALLSWAILFNLVDFPTGLIPWTQVNEGEIDYKGANSAETTVVKEVLAGSIGLPIGLQVVGKPYQEEQCLALMQALDQAKH